MAAPPASDRCRKIRRETAICSSERDGTPETFHTIAQGVRSKLDQSQRQSLVAERRPPAVELRPGYLVNERHPQAQPCEVHRFHVAPAGVARVDAQVIDGGRVEVSQLALVLFTAVDAKTAPHRPRRKAGPAQQGASAAIAAG